MCRRKPQIGKGILDALSKLLLRIRFLLHAFVLVRLASIFRRGRLDARCGMEFRVDGGSLFLLWVFDLDGASVKQPRTPSKGIGCLYRSRRKLASDIDDQLPAENMLGATLAITFPIGVGVLLRAHKELDSHSHQPSSGSAADVFEGCMEFPDRLVAGRVQLRDRAQRGIVC